MNLNLPFKTWLTTYGILGGFLILALLFLAEARSVLTVSYLDVGQGDAILIQTPEHRNILVDAGPDNSVIEGLGKQMGYFDKTIDLFILTHPDKDHYAGILEVFKKYDVRQVLTTGVDGKSQLFEEFLVRANDEGVEWLFLGNEEDLKIGNELYLDLLYPFSNKSLLGQEVKNKNDTSISFRIMKESDSGLTPLALLSGDAELSQETAILLSGQDLKAETYKVGHHGSHSSTSDSFLAAIDPIKAIISAGHDNQFGHPHHDIMIKLEDLEVFRTDRDGTVVVEYD